MTNPNDPYGGYPQNQGWGGHPQQQPQQPQWGQQQQQQPQWQQQQQPQWQQQQPQQHPGFQMPGQQPHAFQQGSEDPNAIASEASVEARNKFIERTYLHLGGAIALFVVLETILQFIPGLEKLAHLMVTSSEYSWLAVIGAFVAVSWIADRWARSSSSKGMQYAGLLLYTVAEAVIFYPLIWFGLNLQLIDLNGIMMAGGVTLAIFAALTAYVMITKKDFSFLRGILPVLALAAIGLIIGSIVFGFTLGLAFVIGMVVLASGYILYYTSNVLKHYRVNQHVAAALALFSAVALLFWYILQLFMRR